MRWRRSVDAVLTAAGLTFTQWLVLDALQELIEETGDAVSQNEVCARVELDRSTVSAVMRLLQEKQLVSRGIDITGRAWRVFLHGRASAILQACEFPIEQASARSELSCGALECWSHRISQASSFR
jgi:DNA-binding MarR family transcriptional regulator